MQDETSRPASRFNRRTLLKSGFLAGAAAITIGIGSSKLAGVAHADGGLQFGWSWCSKCRGLYFGPHQSTSLCPAGGQHAGYETGSNYYYLNYNESDPGSSGSQGEWRWCGNCQGLFYGPNKAKSACPAGGNHVIGAGSFDYDPFLTADWPPGTYLQPDWNWCVNCQGFFYGPQIYESRCPAPTAYNHDNGLISQGKIVSDNYTVGWDN